MKFGLDDTVIEKLTKVFEDNPKVDNAYIFGSRAKGNYRPDSDIDIAIKGYAITLDDLLKMSVAFDDAGITNKIDLLDYNEIKEPALVEHIDRGGVEFYSRWKTIKLIDASESANTGLDAIKRAPIVDYDTGIKCLRIQDVSQSKQYNDWGFCKVEERNFKKFQLKRGEIIIARTGATVGVNIFIEDNLNAVFNNGLIRIRVDTKKCLPKFLYYNFRTEYFKSFIESISGGTSTQPNMQINALLSLEIKLPPISEQTVIANILAGLDNKINLLFDQNRTLEQLSETLFRQWFVEEAEESWMEGVLDDVISVKGGTTPDTTNPEFWNGYFNWTSPRDLSNNNSVFLFDTERKITEKGLKQIGSGLLPVGTVLLSSRAPIGYLVIIEIPVAINQGYIAIICDKLVSNYFIYLWIKKNLETIINASNGSVFLEISKSIFKTLDILIPPREKLTLFDKLVDPMFQKIKTNIIQIQSLTKMRDTLLPKLMSGEVRVKISE